MEVPSGKRYEFVVVNPLKCTNCGLCELACSKHHHNTFNPRKARTRTVKLFDYFFVPLSCRLCDKPICKLHCPYDAIERDEETGVLIVDEDKCVGEECGKCIESCEAALAFYDPEKNIAVTCDLCGEDDPECIDQCPFDALQLATIDEYAMLLKNSYRILKRGIPLSARERIFELAQGR